MAKVKPVMQHDFKDCGVCCMAYLINYYGGFIPIEKLREDTYTSKDGTTAYHMVKAFDKWGFDAVGVLEHDLTSFELNYPLIAHLKLNNNLEHFVVITKVSKNVIYLMDPSRGNIKMALKEFQKLFTGNIILAKPRNSIIKLEKGLTIKKLFFKILFQEKFLILKIIGINLILTILSIMVSYYLKFGSNIMNEDYNLLKYFIILMGIVTLLKVVCTFLEQYYKNHLNNLVDVSIYPKFYNHLFNLPLNTIKTRTSGEVMMRIQELENIKILFTDILTSTFLDVSLVVISSIVLYIINKDLFIILLICIIIYVLLGFLSSKIIYQKINKNINYHTEYNSVVLENISMFESIKNLNITNKILKKNEYYLSKYLYDTWTFNNVFNITSFLKNFILEIGLFVINTYGLISSYKGNLNLIDLFTFNILLSYFLEPIRNVIDILPKYNYIKASFNKISEFINIEEEDSKENNLLIKGDIEFKNITFSYNNYHNILSKFNLVIKEGEHILLDGPSGVGKSTICKLLYKSYLPSEGEILIDNINIKDIALNDIRNNILYISQNELLFTGTIKENIVAYREIENQTFNDICQICLIEDIVSKKGLRYESVISSESNNISGGEAQRIILARGLLKPCNIIILDEALSEVDKNLEKKIIKNIRNYFHDKTIIYISHKNQSNSFKKVIKMGECYE